MDVSSTQFLPSPFAHGMAEGYGLSADDTHFRYVDEFKSAECAKGLDLPTASGAANTPCWSMIRAALAINAVIMLGILCVAAIASVELV